MANPNYIQLPSVIPYGFGFQPDTVQQSNVPIMLQKPESADLIKQKADSDALAQPSTTQVAINARRTAPADKVSKGGAKAPAQAPASTGATPAQAPAPAAPAAAPKDQTQPTVNVNVQSQEKNPYENTPTVTDTPDTQDSIPIATDPGRKNIHTLFQTLTMKDSIPYGEKWRWYLQHGFTGMHGGLHNELMSQVNAEQAAAAKAPKNTYGQELRAQEMKRKTLMQQWDKLLWEWNHGYYSGDEMSVKKFNAVANKLRSAMIAEGISPDLIRDPSINAGGFAQGFQKDISQNRNDLDWLGGWMKTIEDNIAENPDWLNSNQAQMEFDKMSEYIILKWAQSKGAIADAEKIRAQVEAMPDEDRKYYNGFMTSFFKGNALLEMESLAKQGNQHAKELVTEVKRLVNMTPEQAANAVDEDGHGGRSVRGSDHIMQLVALVKADLVDQNLDLPIDLATALESYKLGKEAFDDFIMKNANVDRKMVWDSAADQMKITLGNYNRKLSKLGLYEGWGYDGYVPNKDLSGKLAEWQKNDPTSSVIRNARLSMPSMAGDSPDGAASVDVRGGVGGATPATGVPNKPKELKDKQAYFVDGAWMYRGKNGKFIKWSKK